MPSKTLLHNAAIFSPLGELDETAGRLYTGDSGLVPGPWFGMPVACAPCADSSPRSFHSCAPALRRSLESSLPRSSSETIFIFCAAKGDVSALDVPAPHAPRQTSPLPAKQAKAAARLLGLEDSPRMTVSNACASGAVAVDIAKELLDDREFEHAVLFGLEGLFRFVVSGFHALGALSPTGARPFDARRDGLTPGEGAALAVLSRRAPAPGDIVVAGSATSNDANHRTGPSRTGEGLHRAAAEALRDAGTGAGDIGGVKCHGTATVYNDAMEAKALTALFGTQTPPCVSVKGALGHTSGAGSLLEIILAAEWIRRRKLPPTAGYSEHGVDEPVPITTACASLSIPSMLCLSAGFGGVNAAVVLKEHE